MTLIEKFCEAVKGHEGWFPGSRSWRNNNPSNNTNYSPFFISGIISFRESTTLWIMLGHVSRLARVNLKVLYSIIASLLVLVVNNFVWFKKSPKTFFHHKTMFKNISISISKRMPFRKDVDVSMVNHSPAFIIERAMASHLFSPTLDRTANNLMFTNMIRSSVEFFPTVRAIN